MRGIVTAPNGPIPCRGHATPYRNRRSPTSLRAGIGPRAESPVAESWLHRQLDRTRHPMLSKMAQRELRNASTSSARLERTERSFASLLSARLLARDCQKVGATIKGDLFAARMPRSAISAWARCRRLARSRCGGSVARRVAWSNRQSISTTRSPRGGVRESWSIGELNSFPFF